MPMIDVYAQPGTFAEPNQLAQDLATTLMEIEGVPAIPMFPDAIVEHARKSPEAAPPFSIAAELLRRAGG